MPSERYRQLEERLEELRNHLLPTPFDPTGSYEDEDKVATSVLAYRVLAHAEIEAYFEDRALETAQEARKAWLARQHLSRVALCLMAFSGKEMTSPPDTLQAPSENKRKSWPSLVDIGERLMPIVASYYKLVKEDNHGIRERNLLSLLLPIGIEHTALDPTFLANMDSFGQLRGAAAHTSSRRAVRSAADPADEFGRVASLAEGIKAIDECFDALLAGLANPNAQPNQ
ncbi:hypothetical protein KDW23_21930 [Burkholderia cenocepacia]|uniref:HEPN domain-containing protein n=1 Tax=Burkholderia cenocepacia TaxID=95486 RepID=UPI001BA1E5E8|nr:HEPN domain-containing protein [Burkholderia cenocepacia]MBR8072653.1 hypothetical protein [Burkholderia cenocepacia]MBR8447375.1 hypothetical protein [Burkholderia cenocepacia]